MPRESDLYTPILQGARCDGWALFRIEDGAPGRKPFDITGVAPGGLAVGLEVKYVRKAGWPTLWPWELFETHQIGWLQEYAQYGGAAIVVFRFGNDVTGHLLRPEHFLTGPRLRLDTPSWWPLHGLTTKLRGWPELRNLVYPA
jgi:hypothetical protein